MNKNKIVRDQVKIATEKLDSSVAVIIWVIAIGVLVLGCCIFN